MGQYLNYSSQRYLKILSKRAYKTGRFDLISDDGEALKSAIPSTDKK
jgi:hypothetical protein